MKGSAPRPLRRGGDDRSPAPGRDETPAVSVARTGRRGRRAFTLVEILLTLALMALFATLFVPGVNSMLSAMNDRSAGQQIAEAVLSARSDALERGRTVELRYDADQRRLLWGESGRMDAPLPLGATLDLLPMQAGGSILLGGVLTENQQPLLRVRFFPDGTCEAFRIRLKETDASPVRLFVVDPWTCAASPIAQKGSP